MQKNRKQRSVAIQSTDFFNPDVETKAQPARLSKKAGFRNLLQKSVTLESQSNVEGGGSFSFLEGQHSKSIQVTLEDPYGFHAVKFRTPSVETISTHRRHFLGREEESRRTTSEMVKIYDGAASAKPGTSRMPSMVVNSLTEMSETYVRSNEGSLAVVYSGGEKEVESSRSSNIAFFFGSQGSRRFSDETVILIQDYQSYDLINAAGRLEVDLFRGNIPACCGKSKQRSSVELAARPIPIDEASESEETVCRICHEGEEFEPLMQPCLCKGSIGFVHANCLKKWLEQSSTSRCELCYYPYAIIQTRKYTKCYSIKVFFKTVIDKRSMAYDVISFVVITPLTLVGVVMCLQASLYPSIGNSGDSSFKMGNITRAGLIILSATVVVAYAIWFYTLVAYHYKAWKKWYSHCYNVEVLPVKLTLEERLAAARRLSEGISRRQFSAEGNSALMSYLRSSQNLSLNHQPVRLERVS